MDLKSLQLGLQQSSDRKWVKEWEQKKKNDRNNQMFSWSIFEKVYKYRVMWNSAPCTDLAYSIQENGHEVNMNSLYPNS